MNLSTQETRREDGLRVISKSLADCNTVRIAVVCLLGSAYDPPGKEGAFHFCDHAPFEGTVHRSAAEISDFAERYFIDYNARTDFLDIVYYVEGLHEHFEIFCDVLFDMYLHPTFPRRRIKKETEACLNEIAEYTENPIQAARLALAGLLWKQNPQRLSGRGTLESIGGITRDFVMELHRNSHIPSNTVIIGAGTIDHDLLVERAYAAFPVNDQRVEYQEWDDEYEELPNPRAIVIKKAGLELATISLGCKVPLLLDRERQVFLVLGSMLDSMLYREIREEKGFSYNISSSLGHSQKLGMSFSSTARMFPKRIRAVRTLMLKILCEYELDQHRFEIVKDGLELGLQANFNKPGSWVAAILEKVIHGGGVDLSLMDDYRSTLIGMLGSVTFEEVVAMREKIFTSERFACAIVKPV